MMEMGNNQLSVRHSQAPPIGKLDVAFPYTHASATTGARQAAPGAILQSTEKNSL